MKLPTRESAVHNHFHSTRKIQSTYSVLEDHGNDAFDDNQSQSSTINATENVAISHKKLQQESRFPVTPAEQQQQEDKATTARRSCRLRRVHFDEAQNITYTNETSFKEDCKERWYRSRDFKRFKANMYKLIEDFRSTKSSSGDSTSSVGPLGDYKDFKVAMMECFRACGDEKEPQASSKDATTSRPSMVHMRRNLRALYQSHPERLGVEKMAFSALRNGKVRRRRELRKAVLELQENLRLQGAEYDRQAELLRATSERISETSKLVAHELGRAVKGRSIKAAQHRRTSRSQQ